MFQLFRNFFKTKAGIAVTLAFLALIGFAFAGADVANVGTFGGVAGGDRVAVAGGQRIDAAELAMNSTNTLNQLREEQPTLTMEAFVAAGGLNEVLEQMVQRVAISSFGKKHGVRAGNRLIDSEIVQLSAFRGPDGKFDQALFRSALAQRGISEKSLRKDMELNLIARQLITPIALTPVMPESLGRRYAALLQEQRKGAIALLPSAAYAPKNDPKDEELQTFYDENRGNFVRPERRVIRFAEFDEKALGELPAPTAAQIEERYRRDSAKYAAEESRSFAQLIVPTEDAAKAVIDEVRSGKTLDQAAQDKGLRTVAVGPVTQSAFAGTTSANVAAAAFEARNGALAGPVRGSLGWYVLRVTNVEQRPARSLDAVRNEISAALADEQRTAAFAELTARIEDDLSRGRSLTETAEELGVELVQTRPATANGAIYGARGEHVPSQLGPVLETAFIMEEGDPQLAEIRPGESYMIFDVAEITSSAAAPLAEIREEVVAAWRSDRGGKAAREASDRVMKRIADGSTLAEALAAEKLDLPAPSELDVSREELAQQGQVPAPLALFFSMAQGTTKRLEDRTGNGWYIVQLDKIEVEDVKADSPMAVAAMQQLGPIVGEEYVEQFVEAVRRASGVRYNQAAIDAVAAQLTGRGE